MDWSPRGLWARDPMSLLASVLQAASSVFWPFCCQALQILLIGTNFGAHCIHGDYSSHCPCSETRTRAVSPSFALAVGQE